MDLALLGFIKKFILFFAAAIAGVLFLGSSVFRGPDVVWQSQNISATVSAGGKISRDISFISGNDLQDVSFFVAPEIAPYVSVNPNSFSAVPSGSAVKAQIVFDVPADVAAGVYEGTIHVRIGSRTFAKPLPVTLTVGGVPPEPPAEQFDLFYDDGVPESYEYDPLFGRAVFFTKFVSDGNSVKILGAKIYLKSTVQSAGPLDVYVWDFNRQPMISPVRVTPPTGEGWFFVDLSSYNLVVSNEFYIGVAWPVSEAPPLLGVDLTSPTGNSYLVLLTDNIFIPISNSNMMIRASVAKLSVKVISQEILRYLRTFVLGITL